jgi:predicted enzyme related to lactoylglutathione lyase
MANPFVHVELQSTDPKKAKDFYAKVLDWRFEEMSMPMGVYTMVQAGEGPGAGMMKNPNPQAPSAWLAYVKVDSVEKSLKKARELGARVLVEPTQIPNMGSYAVFAAPTGEVLGLWAGAGT